MGSTTPAFVDIHCHMLPSIDDGAKSWADSLAMGQMAEAEGIGTVIVTPHQLGAFAINTGEIIRTKAAELQRFFKENQIAINVLPGGDVRIEPDMVAKVLAGEVMTLGDHRKHILLELPHEIYFPIEGLLAELKSHGITGILSHPERNQGLLHQPRLLGPLVDAGCLMQVTAGSLVGTFGPAAQALAMMMFEEGLVHFVATDAHGPMSRRPLMVRAHEKVVEVAGQEVADAVCRHNPAQVATGGAVTGGRKRKSRRRFNWFSRRRAG